MSKATPKPFSDDAASFEVAGLTVENGTHTIAFYGQTELTRDKAGLAKARDLLDFAQSVVAALEGDAALPDAVPPPKTLGRTKNPFS